ncbi:MAG TPA: hypothetical protein PKM63_18975 [Panacibacter sp.]|nr:hypothetical protein [Panacibacter sp.]HNP46386.1 hypothetical protein [Panacibacter sp.]
MAKPHFVTYCIVAALIPLSPLRLSAQDKGDGDLFSTDSVLQITVSGNTKELFNDRDENSSMHPMVISCQDKNGQQARLNVNIKTRGHFRKSAQNCIYPPLQFNFTASDTLSQSLFSNQHKLKLVMPCAGDEYVIREYLVYKLYNLITPLSFKVRLAKLNFENTNKKTAVSFYGFFIEEEDQMARRNKFSAVEWKIRAAQSKRAEFIQMAVFEYMIGNTDWSVEYLQNIKLATVDSNSAPITIPYDFDHAGIVNTPYALPAEELHLSSIRERRFRGYCINDMQAFDSVFAKFNVLRPDFEKVYSSCPLLTDKYKKSTLQYLSGFYKTINDAAEANKEFSYPCDPNGTGNVIIKGLRED